MSRWYFSVALDLMCRLLNFEVDLDSGCGYARVLGAGSRVANGLVPVILRILSF